MAWSAAWKAMVPVMPETNTDGATKLEVSFPAHQPSTISKPRTIRRTVGITIPPMTGCLATARYSKSVLTRNAVLTVQKTYTNGKVRQSRKVPAKYIGVSCFKFEINLEDIPAESIQ